jgi:hypothetical protein
MAIKSILFFFLCSISVSEALIINEKFTATFSQKLSDKLWVMNQGMLRDVQVGDHIKIELAGRFLARGYCVKSNAKESVWRVYRNQGALQEGLDQIEVTSISLSDVSAAILREISLGKYAELSFWEKSLLSTVPAKE